LSSFFCSFAFFAYHVHDTPFNSAVRAFFFLFLEKEKMKQKRKSLAHYPCGG
jgi:hypothetical protein